MSHKLDILRKYGQHGLCMETVQLVTILHEWFGSSLELQNSQLWYLNHLDVFKQIPKILSGWRRLAINSNIEDHMQQKGQNLNRLLIFSFVLQICLSSSHPPLGYLYTQTNQVSALQRFCDYVVKINESKWKSYNSTNLDNVVCCKVSSFSKCGSLHITYCK